MDYLQFQIKALPNGNLICTKNGTRTKWYYSNGSHPIYIPKKEYLTAQALALKKYYQFQAEEVSLQLKHINHLLKAYQKYPRKSDELLSVNSPYLDLLTPNFLPNSDLEKWFLSDYSKNPNHPENLIHKCLSGHLVRSKSEVIIANTLFTNKIPFRYECALELNSMILYPDFTVCHPISKRLVYWEHYGLMDNRTYRDNAYNKLKIYGDNGIIPSINLITTYETSKHPIDSAQVQRIVEEYFL